MGSSFRIVTTKTPLRITFAGGGTDFPEYFLNYGDGAVVSASINKYIYVTVAENFYNDEIRVSYSRTENALKSIDEIQHPTVREAMRLLNIQSGIQIVSITEIPSGGTGLGSSSSFLVGLLNALHTWKGEYASPNQLAEEAIKIERSILGEPGGYQDQYIASLGGVKLLEFFRDGTLQSKKLILTKNDIKDFESHILMLYTGVERKSSDIHISQRSNIAKNLETYGKMKDLAENSFLALLDKDWVKLGTILDENWNLKKELTNGISNQKIDNWYKRALKSGAYGGKLMGAGGGGFLLFLCDPYKKGIIKEELSELVEVPIEVEPFGSRVVYME